MAQTLRVTIIGDPSSYARALDKAGHATETFGGQLAKVGKMAALGFAAVGAVALVGAKKAAEAASDMNETVSKTNTVFGKSGKAVENWSEQLATGFGLSKQQALDAVSIFGTFGKAAGVTGAELQKFSKPLVEAAGDLASFHNVPVAQALEDIRSGLSGEVEPLRKYGILLNDAALRSEALKQGLVKTTKDALSPQNKMLAAQALILKDLGDAHGDFARTSGSTANQQRILTANIQNLTAELGQKLLPVLASVLTWVNSHWPQISAAIEAGVNAVEAAIKGISTAVRAIIPVVQSIVAWFQENWPRISEIATGVFDRIAPVVISTFNTIKAIILGAITAIQYIWEHFGAQISAVTVAVFGYIKTTIENVMNVIRGIVNVIGGIIHGDWTRVWQGIQQIFGGIAGQITGAVKLFGTLLVQELTVAGKAILLALSGPFNAIVGIVRGAIATTGAAAKAVGEGIVHGVTDGLAGIAKAITGAFELAWAALKFAAVSAYEFAYKIGGQIIGGILDSLAAIAHKVTGAIHKYITGPIGDALHSIPGFSPPVDAGRWLGNELVRGITEALKHGEKAVASATTGVTDSAGKSAVKGLGTVTQMIIAAAKKYGVDAKAAIAVAMGEGGLKFGEVGDNKTSFGPFQLHIGGASPFSDPAKAAQFANSIQGITYAIKQMAQAGAAGKTGFDAIQAIIRGFERPLDPSSSIARAVQAYKNLGPQVASAVASGTDTVKASITNQLSQLAALVKQYAPQIGVEHARGIIAGLVGKTGDIVAAAKAQMDQIVQAMAVAAQARTDLKTAFQSLAQGALAAFDQVTAAWKPPASILLASLQAEDAKAAADKAAQQAADVVQAAQDAANAARAAGPQEGETPEQFAARLAALDDAYTQAVLAQGDVLRQNFEGELAGIATSEQTAWETHRAQLRENLAGELIDIQASLGKHPEEYAKTQRRIIAVLKRYHVPLYEAGQTLASKFSEGLDDGIGTVVATARKLASALEAIPGVKPPAGGGGGGYDPTTGNLGDVTGGRASSRGDVNVTVNMPNYLGDKTEAARTIRDEIVRINRDNAILA